MARRLNKEYKLDVCNSISLKYGTVNRDNPQVVYVSGKCWVCPLRKMRYDVVMSNIESSFRGRIKSIMADKENFDSRFILDFDICADKLSIGEKKFLSFDFYLRQKEDSKKPIKQLKPLFSRKVGVLANSLVEMLSSNDFSVELKK